MALLSVKDGLGEVLAAADMPFMGKGSDARPDVTEIIRWSSSFAGQPNIAAVERVPFVPDMPGGSSSGFAGRQRKYTAMRQERYQALVVGALCGIGVRVVEPLPKQWQKDVITLTSIKSEDRDAKRKAIKAAVISWCRLSYPSLNLVPPRCKVPRDAWADAVAIAEWGAKRARVG